MQSTKSLSENSENPSESNDNSSKRALTDVDATMEMIYSKKIKSWSFVLVDI